ncbi:hypothetical protein ASE85_09550 [Sphingobium sp. Leaf26]|uniref:hypothetical protein n=1 Tax=Sphingobium sp. Leaf26 TaxID=1735693 RepID=UPI0006F832E1|nr:hypothetical protein [Sphingobium sp. Leaf26]KQN00854.1 hypothetical protein ASE85_09550 [Sphingobium sp. Leaf26]
MENALTIPQPITFAGCGLLFMAYPLIAGWLYARQWKSALCWIAAILLAAGCLIVGIELTEDGVGWIVDPAPLFFRYLGMAAPVAMLFFGVGIVARRCSAR